MTTSPRQAHRVLQGTAASNHADTCTLLCTVWRWHITGHQRSCTSKTAKIHHFVRFVMCCFITTLPVAFYWACSDDTVHYKSDATVNFSCFRCVTTLPITVFYKLRFLHLYLLFFIFLFAKIRCLQHPTTYHGRVIVHLIFGNVIVTVLFTD